MQARVALGLRRVFRLGDAIASDGRILVLEEKLGPRLFDVPRVFVSVPLNEIPMDVLALELSSNRNAIYENLFDARQTLRAHMAASGHPVGETSEAVRRAPGRSARVAGAAL